MSNEDSNGEMWLWVIFFIMNMLLSGIILLTLGAGQMDPR